MKNYSLFKTGCLFYIISGLCHLLIYLFVYKSPIIADNIKDVTIHFLGDRTLKEYLNGYSWLTGLMIMSFGIQNFIYTRNGISKSIFITTFCISFLIMTISIIHFNYVIIITDALATTLFGISLFNYLKPDKKVITII